MPLTLVLNHKTIDSSLKFRMTLKSDYCHSELVEESMVLALPLNQLTINKNDIFLTNLIKGTMLLLNK